MSPQAATGQVSDAVILERARSFANEAMWTIALQRRRARSTEPEDHKFASRWWVDLQFLIVALRRLRRAAELASRVSSVAPLIESAMRDFDAAVPQLFLFRNVGEHIDDYLLGGPKRRHKQVGRAMLQVGTWDGTTYRWLKESLNVDLAHGAAVKLCTAVRTASRSLGRP